MTDTEKMLMTEIIGNIVADNIVFGVEVLAHNPEELSLEIWEVINNIVHVVTQTNKKLCLISRRKFKKPDESW